MREEQPELREEQGFIVRMPDYATPSFCTFDKAYVGTPALLRTYTDARKKLDPKFQETGVHCDTVSILTVKELRMEPFQWNHRNVWNCVYRICADQGVAKLAYIKAPDRYFRCVLADFWNPTYEGRPLNGRFWGQPAMLVYESGRLYNRLMYVEKPFRTETEMLADAEHPAKIDFSGFFDDVFGDG